MAAPVNRGFSNQQVTSQWGLVQAKSLIQPEINRPSSRRRLWSLEQQTNMTLYLWWILETTRFHFIKRSWSWEKWFKYHKVVELSRNSAGCQKQTDYRAYSAGSKTIQLIRLTRHHLQVHDVSLLEIKLVLTADVLNMFLPLFSYTRTHFDIKIKWFTWWQRLPFNYKSMN